VTANLPAMETLEMKWRIEEANREVERLREQVERELSFLAARVERGFEFSSRRAERESQYLSQQMDRGFALVRELVKGQEDPS